ncbi:MAG: hypothetical protein Aurels2KO_54560 [Aureliella sp.]
MAKKKSKAPAKKSRGRKPRDRVDALQEREPGTGQRKRLVLPAPIYDIVGWVTEADAAEIKSAQTGKSINRTTISRWRSGGFINSIDINEALIIVNEEQLMEFEGIPMGNPVRIKSKMPERADPLPRTIRVKLKRRR